MPAEATERRLAAILFTDIVGYTALMARDEEAGRRTRDRHEAVVPPLVERYHVEWIERTGLTLFGRYLLVCSTRQRWVRIV